MVREAAAINDLLPAMASSAVTRCWRARRRLKDALVAATGVGQANEKLERRIS